ncbi:MAG: hypothetical protein C4567_10315 [Deltaproteobacteria bacterium]|nr:MAG: hypothetical protein C4567_10315 [Deltaproteobacteria bacterium]
MQGGLGKENCLKRQRGFCSEKLQAVVQAFKPVRITRAGETPPTGFSYFAGGPQAHEELFRKESLTQRRKSAKQDARTTKKQGIGGSAVPGRPSSI